MVKTNLSTDVTANQNYAVNSLLCACRIPTYLDRPLRQSNGAHSSECVS